MKPIKALAVVGATASGKTALSLPLGEKFRGEILSMDSMQIYRGMDIGTAKATGEEQKRVPHHLLDIVEPTEEFSAADYGDRAYLLGQEIEKRGHLPIFVGGTGLYLEAARTGRHRVSIPGDPLYREELMKLAETKGKEAVYDLLLKCDPASAEQIHPNNVRRVVRALEIYHTAGRTKSELDRESQNYPPRFQILTFFLRIENRELLYRRIDERVEKMFRMGLWEEVEELLQTGKLRENTTAYQAIGYKEIIDVMQRGGTREEAMEAVCLSTHHYAKRQNTWFSAMKEKQEILLDRDGKMRPPEEILEEAYPIAEAFLQNGQNGQNGEKNAE